MIEDIRKNIADRATFDSNMLPTTEALHFHWKRSCWVLNMWGQADHNVMRLGNVTEYGWSIMSGKLCIVWDTEQNMQSIRERVSVLLKGCKCVTGCRKKICKCRKKGMKCTEGCQCMDCQNQTAEVLPDYDLGMIGVQEEATYTRHSPYLQLQDEELQDEEFSEFVFAAQDEYDIDIS